jgi:UDP-N-acetylglucosamine--N-acetylmuramyl-(pentapeptide) pyrophosphoryl-undecaprenol N-acetylglucosamine transferase
MGGSRGSSFINKLAVSLMPMLLKKYQVVHITGEKDFSEIVRFKSTLPKVLVKNYKIFPAIEPFQMAGIYEDSDLVIARAGANSVSEILYLKKPAIFIPLALSFADEQTKNAKYAESFGFVRVVSESKATSKTLIDEISDIFKNYDTILKKASDKTSLDSDASKKIVDILSKY